MLVEMATGTGKTRTAAALTKRLFDANWSTRALFVVDRNTLAIQAEDAFAEHLPHLPCYRVPRTGRRFQDEKRVNTFSGEYQLGQPSAPGCSGSQGKAACGICVRQTFVLCWATHMAW